MPRVSNDARPDRDDLVVTLYLTGRSYRAIGRDPRVQLSDRGARLAVQRGLATSPPPKHLLEQLMADAYQGSLRGEVHGVPTPVRGVCPACGCARRPRRLHA